MSKFSVKKPLTVFVAVIAILVLGVVAYTRMTPDLLPNMDFPYVMILTTYPGASPEKVESEITKPMEQAMSTLEHIKEVSSTSSENASMVMLEFEDSVNMDTIGVDIQQKITTLSANWDDTVGSPYVLKINPSMLPVEVAALSMEGMDTIALTEFVDDTLMNKLEGIPGVARITATGKIEQQIHVVLDQDMIDALNRKIADAVNGELDDAAQELEDQKKDLENAKGQIAGAESQLSTGANALVQGEQKLKEEKEKLESAQTELESQLVQAKLGKAALTATYEGLNLLNDQVNNVVSAQQAAQERVNALGALQQERAEIAALQQEIDDLKNYHDPEAPEPDPEEPGGDEADQEAADYALPFGELEGELLPASDEEAFQAEAAAFFPSEQERTVTVDLGFGVKARVRQNAEISIMTLAGGDRDTEIALKEAELIQKKAAHEANLIANGVTDDTLDAALAQAEGNLAVANAAVAQIDALLASQGTTRAELAQTVAETKAQLDQVNDGIAQLEEAQEQLASGMITVEQAESMLEQQKILGMLQISTAAGKLAASSSSIEMALKQIDSGLETIEDSREGALRQADLNNIITMDMVTKILTAQNFAMPAGYVEQDGINYMVSIGDEITDLETLENLLLFELDLEGVDPIYLKDVAVVMVTDNRDETYAKLNGQDGLMLSFEKQSTYSTAETTNNIQARFRELEKEYPGLQFVALMNQGDYIYLIVNTILNSLLLGALFAILVLYLFLKDLRPTFITLCAIPISVIFAIVLMYFTGVTINMISLSGLAVAVGMLVDNSVVVIENIYRLRAKGANVIQAAVSGAGQVAGAVTASTLTTVCVFLPIVFVEGITRQLFTDLALTMSYALLASLIVSLTLVPAMASGMLRKEKQAKPGFLEKKLLPLYEKSVRWALDHKVVILLAAAALLVATAAGSLSRGFIFMPEMDMPNVNVSVTMPEGADMEQASGLADEVLDRISQIDGIATVGAMMDVGTSSIAGVSQTSYNVTEVPLSDFATVEETSSLASINRLSQRRYLTVSAELQPGYNVTLLSAEAEKAMAQADLGQGVTYTFTGENETIMESVRQLILMLLLGVLLVYLVMVAQFQSLKSPFIVMFTIPLAFTGGFLGLLICGMEVSVISLIGFIMLTGIIVNNGIVLVDYINQLRLDGKERREAIVEAGITRMRPILMTTITTVLGLIDMAVRKSAGTALMRPIAVVCIGGLIYATLMTLFVVPCIYDLFNKKELRNVREADLKLLDI